MKHDWIKVRLAYEASTISMRDCAEKYKIPFGTLARKAKKEDWCANRAQNEHKIVTEATKDMAADRIASITLQNARDDEIVKLMYTKAVEMSQQIDGPQALKAWTGSVKDMQHVSRLALGMTTDSQSVAVVTTIDQATTPEQRKAAAEEYLRTMHG